MATKKIALVFLSLGGHQLFLRHHIIPSQDFLAIDVESLAAALSRLPLSDLLCVEPELLEELPLLEGASPGGGGKQGTAANRVEWGGSQGVAPTSSTGPGRQSGVALDSSGLRPAATIPHPSSGVQPASPGPRLPPSAPERTAGPRLPPVAQTNVVVPGPVSAPPSGQQQQKSAGTPMPYSALMGQPALHSANDDGLDDLLKAAPAPPTSSSRARVLPPHTAAQTNYQQAPPKAAPSNASGGGAAPVTGDDDLDALLGISPSAPTGVSVQNQTKKVWCYSRCSTLQLGLWILCQGCSCFVML